jgi:Tfp pilus assembly PilM family ATPase
LQNIAIQEQLSKKKLDELKDMDPAYAVAVGLALREVEE